MVLECVEMFFSQIVETIVEMLKLNARNYSNLIASLLTLILHYCFINYNKTKVYLRNKEDSC